MKPKSIRIDVPRMSVSEPDAVLYRMFFIPTDLEVAEWGWPTWWNHVFDWLSMLEGRTFRSHDPDNQDVVLEDLVLEGQKREALRAMLESAPGDERNRNRNLSHAIQQLNANSLPVKVVYWSKTNVG